MEEAIRPAPAYQEYASDMLANYDFRVLSLAERGLVHTLKLECWVNHKFPADKSKMARALGFDQAEIDKTLNDNVMAFFEVNDGFLFSPELELYRAKQQKRRSGQSAGGKKGAEKTNSVHQKAKAKAPESKSQATRELPASKTRVLSRDEMSGVETKRTEQSLEKGVDSFVSEYEAEDDSIPF